MSLHGSSRRSWSAGATTRSLHRGPYLRHMPRRLPDVFVRRCRGRVRAAVSRQIQDLRRLLYCGEWLQSHALHVYFLHAPDFLGLEDAVAVAERDHSAVERGLALKKTGNKIMETVGGRAVHPVNVRVGGFYKAPAQVAVRALAEPLHRALDASLETVRRVSGFDFPDVENDYTFDRRDPGRYPMEVGRAASPSGLDCTGRVAGDRGRRTCCPFDSPALAAVRALSYLTGPLSRYALNSEALTPLAEEAAAAAGLGREC